MLFKRIINKNIVYGMGHFYLSISGKITAKNYIIVFIDIQVSTVFPLGCSCNDNIH